MADQGQSPGPRYRPNPSNDEQERLEEAEWAGGSRVFSGGSVSGGGVIPKAYGRAQAPSQNPGVVSWYSDRAWDDSRPGVASEPEALEVMAYALSYESIPPFEEELPDIGGMLHYGKNVIRPHEYPGWYTAAQAGFPAEGDHFFYLLYPKQKASWGEPWQHDDRYEYSGKFVPKDWEVESEQRFAKANPIVSCKSNQAVSNGGPLLDLQCAIDNLPTPTTLTFRWSIIPGDPDYGYYKVPFPQTAPHPIRDAAEAASVGGGFWFKGHNENIPGIDEWRADIALAFAKWKEILEEKYPGLIVNFVNIADEVWGLTGPLPGLPLFRVSDHPEAADIRFSMATMGLDEAGRTNRRPLCLEHPSLGEVVSIGSNIRINSKYRWRPDARSDPFSLSMAYCVFHEIGHYLGMAHNEDWTSLMQVSQQTTCLSNKPNGGPGGARAFYTSWSDDLDPRVGGTAKGRDQTCLGNLNSAPHNCVMNCTRLGEQVQCPQMEITITAENPEGDLPKTWCGITWQPPSVDPLSPNDKRSGESVTICPDLYRLSKTTETTPLVPLKRFIHCHKWEATDLNMTRLRLEEYRLLPPYDFYNARAWNWLTVDGRRDRREYWRPWFYAPIIQTPFAQLEKITTVPFATLNDYRLTDEFFGSWEDDSGVGKVVFKWVKRWPPQWD